MQKPRIYTVRDFYNRLNRKQKRKFKKAFLQERSINAFNSFMNRRCDDFNSLISSGFIWGGTKQGQDYWYKLSLKYESLD